MNVDDLALALGLGAARGARALARSIGGDPQRVVALGEAIARALAEAGHEPLRTRLERGRLPLEDASVDALCASGLPDPSIAPEVLRECARVVKDGGRVLLATAAGLVGRGPERQVLTALFMHAGLVDIQQQLVRGTAITSGRVRR
jgi:SAM-dependent methyltransferase